MAWGKVAQATKADSCAKDESERCEAEDVVSAVANSSSDVFSAWQGGQSFRRGRAVGSESRMLCQKGLPYGSDGAGPCYSGLKYRARLTLYVQNTSPLMLTVLRAWSGLSECDVR